MRERRIELECIVIDPPVNKCDASIIWLHGLGADANDFVGIVQELRLPNYHTIRFILPHAPYRTITLNDGMKMRGWYDIFDMALNIEEDEVGIKESQQLMHALIEQEISAGINSKRIILAGFSQGGAIALYTGLRFDKALGGIIALSTYQVLSNALESESHMANKNVPIFMAHGMFDPVVPFNIGKMSCSQMQSMNYQVQWQTYPMQHTVVPEEIQHIGAFIQEHLGSLWE